jgi:hypothetical protein
VHIAPAEGRCEALPTERAWEVRLRGCREPRYVVVNSVDVADWDYDPATLTITVRVPRRSRALPVTVTTLAEGPLNVLGAERNQARALADARRLLGVEAGSDAELLEAALRGNTAASLDAVARLGGPFAHFLEFTTPEEAAQRLGWVIMGAPGEGDSYDIEVDWTLYRAGRPEQYRVRVEQATAPQILDTPFAFAGTVEALSWEAEARLTWRGHVLRYTHHSRTLFPPVQAWRVAVYDPTKGTLTPEQALSADPRLWRARSPDVAALHNLSQPFLLSLGQENCERLQAGEPLAACLVTTVDSPAEREATLLVRTRTRVEVSVDGMPVEVGPPEEEFSFYPFEARRTAPFHLRAGENTLVVHSWPDPEGKAAWFVGAELEPAAHGRCGDQG